MKFFGIANPQRKPNTRGNSSSSPRNETITQPSNVSSSSPSPLTEHTNPSSISSATRDEQVNIHNLSLNDHCIDVAQASEDTALRPLVSPAYEDVPMWNILPSYQLYQSTFSKNLQPSEEDLRTQPPTYEGSSHSVSPSYFSQHLANNPTGSYFPAMDNPSNDVAPELPPFIESPEYRNQSNIPLEDPSQTGPAVEDSPTRWEDSILGNSHRLKKLTDLNNAIAGKLKIDIQITDKPGKRGVKPRIIEPQQFEYQQGDSINGFVTIVNTSSESMPFDMFSVVFEGKVSVMGDSADSRRPIVFYKFLNMFDYSASWTPAELDEDYVSDLDEIDPVDNTRVRFSINRHLQPNIMYKKFFNFKIPEKLLDCACEMHNLSGHCEMPPTIGLERDEFLKKLRKMRERTSTKPSPQSSKANSGPGAGRAEFDIGGPSSIIGGAARRKSGLNGIFSKRVKDLSFPDTAISYSVEARVVAKKSDFAHHLSEKDKNKDQFIIVNEASSFLRVVPRERLSLEFDQQMLQRESEMIYQNLIVRVKDKIELGKTLLEASNQDVSQIPLRGTELIPENRSSESLSKIPSTVKQRQLYQQDPSYHVSAATHRDYFRNDEYQVILPIKKKSLGAAPKIIGIIDVSTPKVDYIIRYIPPYDMKRFVPRTDSSSFPTSITIPLNVAFKFTSDLHSKTHKPPEIKSICADLVVATYRSTKFPIPIEMINDLKFRNIAVENDNLEGYVINPFKKYVDQISRMTSVLGSEVLNIDSQFIMDIKALANLSVKYNHLKVDHVKSQCRQGLATWGQPSVVVSEGQKQEIVYDKKLEVIVDIKNLLLKEISGSHEDLGADAYALIPNFQGCICGRYYYLNLQIKLHNHDSVFIKVPITIRA